MNQPAEKTGYTVTFSGEKDYPDETMRRGRAMLEALLDDSDAPKGEYLFNVIGLYSPFEKLATARLEVERGRIETAVQIRLRSRGGNGGSIVGSLYLPPTVKRDALFGDMEITVDNFNRGGNWAEVLQNLSPNRSPKAGTEIPSLVGRVSPAPHSGPLSRGTHERACMAVLPSLSVVSAPSQQGSATLVRKATDLNKETSMPTMTRPEMLAKLTEFLKAVARGVADSNGVFPSAGIGRLSAPLFPGQQPRWLGQGILFELEALGWVHHVTGKGQYQIDVAFVVEHGLGLSIRPLPKFVRGQGATPVMRKERPGQGSSLESLLEQQRTLTTQIREAAHTKQRELTLAIERARADVMAAERRVAEAEAELIAHNEEHAHLLVAVPP